jgi:hypothetical protein
MCDIPQGRPIAVVLSSIIETRYGQCLLVALATVIPTPAAVFLYFSVRLIFFIWAWVNGPSIVGLPRVLDVVSLLGPGCGCSMSIMCGSLEPPEVSSLKVVEHHCLM